MADLKKLSKVRGDGKYIQFENDKRTLTLIDNSIDDTKIADNTITFDKINKDSLIANASIFPLLKKFYSNFEADGIPIWEYVPYLLKNSLRDVTLTSNNASITVTNNATSVVCSNTSTSATNTALINMAVNTNLQSERVVLNGIIFKIVGLPITAGQTTIIKDIHINCDTATTSQRLHLKGTYDGTNYYYTFTKQTGTTETTVTTITTTTPINGETFLIGVDKTAKKGFLVAMNKNLYYSVDISDWDFTTVQQIMPKMWVSISASGTLTFTGICYHLWVR